MNTEQKLWKLKNRIKQAQTAKNQSEGRKSELLRQLKETFKCSSIAAGEKKLEEMEKRINVLNDGLKKGISEIEENYDI